MKQIEKAEKIIIFGVGDIGTDLYWRLKENSIHISVDLCDNNPQKQGTYLDEKQILSPIDAVNRYPVALYVITVINHTEAVTEQLKKLGVSEENIVIFSFKDYINEEDEQRQLQKQREYSEWCEKYNGRIRRFKDKYKNKRCFIIGNGSSLTVKDLEMLKDEITFGCNRLYKLYAGTSWRPTFYCFYDVLRVKKIKGDLPYILDNCKALFTSSTIKDQLDINVIEDDKTFFVHVEKEKYYPDFPKFSENAEKGVYDGQSVLYIATQLAFYMGFSEIYYLGADNHYSIELNLDGTVRVDKTVKDYPDEIGKIELESSVIPQMELTTLSFEAVRVRAQKCGKKVMNATRGGKLEVFERIGLEKLLMR